MSYEFEKKISDSADALHLSSEAREKALQITKQLVEEEIRKFQTYGGFDAVLAFSVYTAARNNGEPISASDLEEYYNSQDSYDLSEHFKPSKIRSSYKVICDLLDLEFRHKSLDDYRKKIISKLEVDEETLNHYDKIVSKLEEEVLNSSPKSVASASIYIASALSKDSNERLKQSEISEELNISRPAIRSAKNSILEKLTQTDISRIRVDSPRFSPQLLGLGGQ